jgi:glycosyltransferase domain-containing protein
MIKKALYYWGKKPVELIILDGSEECSLSEVELGCYPKLIYIHKPMPISVEKRLYTSLEFIKTPFVQIISDDEYILYSYLSKAVECLESDDALVAVVGDTVGFSMYKNKFHAWEEYRSINRMSISSSFAIERIKERCTVTGFMIFYSLMRANVYKIAVQMIAEHSYTCPYISEYQMDATICALGRVKYLPRLAWFRNRGNLPVYNQQFDRKIYFNEWLSDSSNSIDRVRLEKCFDKYIGKYFDGQEDIGKIVVEIFSKFEKKSLSVDEKNWIRIIYYLKRIVSKLLPINFKRHLKSTLFRLGLIDKREDNDLFLRFEKKLNGIEGAMLRCEIGEIIYFENEALKNTLQNSVTFVQKV